jgi:hypothetical protein
VAPSATPRAIDGDRIAFFVARNARPNLRHPPGIFVSQREFAAEAEIFFHNVQVRVAYSGAADFDHNLSGARLRLCDLDEVSGMADANKSYCLH